MLATAAWVMWTIGLGLLTVMALLVFLAWWALFSDRPGDRRRCPRCWYDLTYSPGMTCPECGFAGRAERQFKKTRPKRAVALVAILGCTGIGLFIIDRANNVGVMAYVPTRVLIAMMPAVENPRGSVFADLDRRIRAGELSPGQWLALTRRCALGDDDARPPDDAWVSKYGGLLAMAGRRIATGEDATWRPKAETILLEIPVRLELSTRETWPAGVGPTVAVAAADWWPRDVHWRVRAKPDLPGAAPDVHVLRDVAIQPRSYSMLLPPLPEGDHLVRIDLAIERRREGDPGWELVERWFETLPIQVEGGLAQTLAPLHGTAADQAIRAVFRSGLAGWRRGSLPVRVRVDQRQTHLPIFDETAVGLHVDVLRNGVLGRQLRLWWLGGEGRFDRQHAWEVPMLDDEVLGVPPTADDVWTLQVRGVPELALRVEGATKYWAGEFTMNVNVQMQRGNAPPRGWVVDEEDEPEPFGDGAEIPHMNQENLWAPWRAAYLRELERRMEAVGDQADPPGNFLAAYWNQPERDHVNHVIHRNDRGMILLNRYPYANGHLLVALGHARPTLLDYEPEDRAAFWSLVETGFDLMQRALGPQGINMGINQGRAAGAGVPEHLHAHLVPRWSADTNFITVTGQVRVIPDALESIASAYRAVGEASGDGAIPGAPADR